MSSSYCRGIKIQSTLARLFAGSALVLLAIVLPGKLQAQTTMVVAGQVEGTSIKIKDWTLDAPDYVFEPEYKLDSVEAIRNYIKKNKHLPGIPSAKEIKEKGINLADMNFKLLQKIEELTLHMIQQEARIKAMESKNK